MGTNALILCNEWYLATDTDRILGNVCEEPGRWVPHPTEYIPIDKGKDSHSAILNWGSASPFLKQVIV